MDSGADDGTAPQLVDNKVLVGMEDDLFTSDHEEQGMALNLYARPYQIDFLFLGPPSQKFWVGRSTWKRKENMNIIED